MVSVRYNHRQGDTRPLGGSGSLFYPVPRYRPTVCLNVTSLVVSSCVYNWGQIEQRVAHFFSVNVATQRGLAERTEHGHPPRAQPVSPMRLSLSRLWYTGSPLKGGTTYGQCTVH